MSPLGAQRISDLARIEEMRDWRGNYRHGMHLAREWKWHPEISARHRSGAMECAAEARKLASVVLRPKGQLSLAFASSA